MRPRLPRLSGLSGLALILSLLGFGASIASAIDYAAPTFCSESGCATVRASAWAHPLGIPMPAFGIAFFAAMIALSFADRPRLRKALAIAGGVGAIALIAIQAFVIGAWCKLCMVNDPIAIALALVVVAGAGVVRFRMLVLAAPLAAVVPIGFALLTEEPPAPVVVRAASGAPEVIAREQRAGSATVVDFIDFECPFCRKLAPQLDAAIAQAGVPVRLVRKMVPLAMHAHALDAALAWCCADAQGKGDEMAQALFAAPADDLTPDGCEALAVSVGCDRTRYRESLADPELRARIDRDRADFRAAGLRSLPTVYIGETAVSGSDHDAGELVAAITHAVRY
ncbi:MAG: vitamin K epoxide reductase family protein [Kofleriaceae bacterium]